jgi:hypothetical protein
MSADSDHEKCTQSRKKDCLAYSAFSNSNFLGNVRNVRYPCAENKTETGIQKSRSKIFFVLKEKFNRNHFWQACSYYLTISI